MGFFSPGLYLPVIPTEEGTLHYPLDFVCPHPWLSPWLAPEQEICQENPGAVRGSLVDSVTGISSLMGDSPLDQH